jgi:IMP dehydrogenase
MSAVTDDGSSRGRLLGLITSRDFHPDRHDRGVVVANRMVPVADLACGDAAMTRPEANTRLWEERLDYLPSSITTAAWPNSCSGSATPITSDSRPT